MRDWGGGGEGGEVIGAETSRHWEFPALRLRGAEV